MELQKAPSQTIVVRGFEETTNMMIKVTSNAKSSISTYADSSSPSILFSFQTYHDLLVEAKSLGVKMRYITEITKDNVKFCKKMIDELGIELRHLNGLKGSFSITDSEYIALTSVSESLPQLIYSNMREIVEQNQFLFDNVWSRAIPAKQKIEEIESGIDLGYTRFTYDRAEIFKTFSDFIDETTKEALIMLPTSDSLSRNVAFFQKLSKLAREKNVRVSILFPSSNETNELQRKMELGLEGIEFREAELKRGNLSIGIYDRKRMITAQYLEPSGLRQENLEQASIFATITTNAETIRGISYIFEALWRESELRERETKSRKQAELMQDILAHDIRNYNQVMRLSTELLQQELPRNPTVKVVGDSMLRAIEGSTDLVQKAKQFGKILSEANPRLYPVSLAEAVENSFSLVKSSHSFGIKTISNSNLDEILDTKESHVSAQVLADEFLPQVFVNLYSNAAKHTDSDNVEIETSFEAEEEEGVFYWKVSISDHGRGIPDEMKDKIFTRYLNNAKGTGLGLSIVHALVVGRYRGKLKVKDRNEGDRKQGTIVEVWLPKCENGS
ncbi:MAG: ATP-binding protein [Nitrososphaerales archaeon]